MKHSPPASDSPKTDADYWLNYLTTRKHVESTNFSALIEHDETHFYFPLGSDEESQASEMAQRIYLAISEAGWETACRQFVRELTIGVFWNQNPVLVTYSTIFSRLRPPEKTPETEAIRAAIIEPDITIRYALCKWLNEIPGWSCAADYGSMAEALDDARLSEKAEIAFANCGFFSAQDYYPSQLRPLRERLEAFPFSIHFDSDHLFLHVTDATHGYFLRRTKLHELLAPIAGVERDAAKHANAIQHYFCALCQSPVSAAKAHLNLKSLTPREWEILSWLSQGLLNKEIADRLEISLHTVRNHLSHLFQKIGVNNRTEAVLWYLQK